MSGWYAFSFAPDWIRTGVELAPLHMPLRREPYEFPELSRATFHGLPAMMADALPDAGISTPVAPGGADEAVGAPNQEADRG